MRRTDDLILSDDQLSFFRLTCDLMPLPESPLRYLEDRNVLPSDAAVVHRWLVDQGMMAKEGERANEEVASRVGAVAEASARIIFRQCGAEGVSSRSYYVRNHVTVQYRWDGTSHHFGPPRREGALAAEFSTAYQPVLQQGSSTRPWALRLSASDYLVFAVFARDVRATSDIEGDAPMSMDEVLGYFENDATLAPQPTSDETWATSLRGLEEQGVLVKTADNDYALHRNFHPLATELVSDHQHCITRCDFVDEQWLVREVTLYPTDRSVYRMAPQPNGDVLIQALSQDALADVIAGVVETLPNLLDADIAPSVRSPSGMSPETA